MRTLLEKLELPDLKISKSNYQSRSATPIELFFDLVFALVFSSLSPFLMSGSISTLVGAILIFIILINVWLDVSTFTMYYYEERGSYFIRFSLVLSMIPIVLLVSLKDFNSIITLKIFIMCILLSKLIFMSIWYITTFLNKKIRDEFLKDIIKKRLIMAGLENILLLIAFFNLQYTYIILFLIVFLENIVLPIYTEKISKNKKIEIYRDEELLLERIILLFILIFGEGIIISSHLLDITQGMLGVITPIIVFLTIAFFFLRIYDDMVDYKIGQVNIYIFVFSAIITGLNTLILFNAFGQVGHNIYTGHELSQFNIILMLIVFLYIAIFHLMNNIIVFRRNNKNLKFYKIDILSNVIMIFIAIGLPFIKENFLLLIMIFFFFLIHLVPVLWKKK